MEEAQGTKPMAIGPAIAVAIVLAGVVWSVAGRAAALAGLGFAWGTLGLSVGVVKILTRFFVQLPSWSWILVAGSLIGGMIIDHVAVVPSVGILLRPSLDLEVPHEVAQRQPVSVAWSNLATSDRVWILVSDAADTLVFPQRCAGISGRSGSISDCVLEIGGDADAGKRFVIRVARMDTSADRQLASVAADPINAFLLAARLPPGVVVGTRDTAIRK